MAPTEPEEGAAPKPETEEIENLVSQAEVATPPKPEEVESLVANDEENNKQEEEMPEGFAMTDLDKDIYSLIFTGNVMGPGFWFGVSVALFQGAIVWLVLYDLIEWGDDFNPLRIPAGNDRAVTIAQGALLILMSQSSMDLMEGLEFVIDGYYKDVLNICPHATFAKWLFAGLAHIVVGGLLAVVIFILLLQETTVFGLGVDFVAMNKFFAQIDNIAFNIGKRGVFSVQLSEECKHVGEVKVRRNQFYTWSRRIIDVILIGTVMTGYGILTHRQKNGRYICNSIFVQLGDVFNPGIGEISGMFDTIEEEKSNRVIYQERSSGEFRFAYCGDQERWTLTPYLNGIFEPCGSAEVDVLARSAVTGTYDILTTKDTWAVESVRHGTGYNPFTHFSMLCNQCAEMCNVNGGVCDENEKCFCREGFYGLNCEFENPCSTMSINLQTQIFPPFLEDLYVPTRFEMLKNFSKTTGQLQVEYRPIYQAKTADASFILVFNGRRWLLFAAEPQYGDPNFMVDLFTEYDFNMIDTVYSPLYASSPMDIGTPADGATPDDLDWFYVARKHDGPPFSEGDDDTPRSYRVSWWVEENQPLDTRLHCAYCNDDVNPCKNFGICDNATSTCDCFKEAGTLCEYELKCTDPDPTDPAKVIGCPHNATCGRDGRCDCPVGYSGKTCQVETLCQGGVSHFDQTPIGPCFRGGTCNTTTGTCSCLDSYDGALCQLPEGDDLGNWTQPEN